MFTGLRYGEAIGGETGYRYSGQFVRHFENFVQANIGKRKENIETGFSFRIAYSHFFCKYDELK